MATSRRCCRALTCCSLRSIPAVHKASTVRPTPVAAATIQSRTRSTTTNSSRRRRTTSAQSPMVAFRTVSGRVALRADPLADTQAHKASLHSRCLAGRLTAPSRSWFPGFSSRMCGRSKTVTKSSKKSRSPERLLTNSRSTSLLEPTKRVKCPHPSTTCASTARGPSGSCGGRCSRSTTKTAAALYPQRSMCA